MRPLFTTIDSPIGELSICNILLQYPVKNFPEEAGSEDRRLKELEIILGHVSRYKNLILLGDFNSISRGDNYDLETLEYEPRFDVTSKLARDYVDVASYLKLDDRITYPTPVNKNPSYTMPLRIDYVFISLPLGVIDGARSGSRPIGGALLVLGDEMARHTNDSREIDTPSDAHPGYGR